MIRCFFLFCLLFIVSSCSNKRDSVVIAPFSTTVKVSFIEEINLSQLIDSSYFYIPLQTESTPLIGRINRIVPGDSAYYVLDSQFAKSVFKFNKEGAFMHSIGQLGEGNGEYLNPNEIIVTNEFIEIIDGTNYSILRFQGNGKFINEIRVPYWISEANQFSESKKIIYSPTDYSPSGKVENGVISIISNDFNKVFGTYFPYEEVLDDAPFPDYLCQYKNTFTYVKPLLGEFYKIKEDMQITPLFKIDFGKYDWPEDVRIISIDQQRAEEVFLDGNIMSIAHQLCENVDYLTFRSLMIDPDLGNRDIDASQNIWFCIYNKKSQKLVAIKKVINDFDGGIFPLPAAVDTSEEEFIGVIPPELLANHYINNAVKDKSRYEDLVKMTDTLKDSNNPILMRYRFRKDLFN